MNPKTSILLIFFLSLQFILNAEDMSTYNVVWKTPSRHAAGTMPIGNGDIGANVYAIENGSLYLLLSKSDAFTYQGDLYKTGRVRIDFSKNIFKKDTPFIQTLDLNTGSIHIKTKDVSILIWADIYAPVFHIQIDSKQNLEVKATPEFWERFNGTFANTYEEKDPVPIVQDQLCEKQNQLIWYYHVGNCSVFDDDLSFYDVEYMNGFVKDPYRYNTFGNLLECNEMTREDHQLTGDGKKFDILIHFRTEQVKNPDTWISNIQEQASNYINDPARWTDHISWWKNFWERSWIKASNNQIARSEKKQLQGEADSTGIRTDKDDAALISQNYNVFRFLMACQSRGKIQTKFNGGIFTQQLMLEKDNESKREGGFTDTPYGKLTHEDSRLWGRRFTWQNQRLLYWPLLASGDFDLMNPFFQYYNNILPIRKEINKMWFGHRGAYFRENVCPAGFERDCQPVGGKNPSEAKPAKIATGETAVWYHSCYFYSGLELVLMMLEYSDYTEDVFFRNNVLIPMAREVIQFFDFHYPRDNQGKLLIDPAQVLETYWRAKNPAPEISALHVILKKLLSSQLGNDKDQKEWADLYNILPDIPMQKDPAGNLVIAPAEEYNTLKNSENGELYPVFPAKLYGVAHSSQDIVTNTINVRSNKDALHNSCWCQDDIDWAYAGNASKVVEGLNKRFRRASTAVRFPLFGRETPDSCPDFDHFGSGSVALQSMIFQENGEKIFLFPAWPAKWDLNFKLHASKNTIIEGKVEKGQLIYLHVTPSHRMKDIYIGSFQ